MFEDPRIQVLLDAQRIQARVAELGAQITADYAQKDLVIVGVLKGCFPFVADLVRQIHLPLAVDFLGVSSYGEATNSSGVVRLTNDLSKSIESKDVLIVEDIVDTGLTMQYLLENLVTRRPASLSVCTLLYKPARNRIPIEMRYIGFTIPDEFVIGYGLDYGELYRNLPFVGVMSMPEG